MKEYSLLIPYQNEDELRETVNFFKFIIPEEYRPLEIISTNSKGLGYARNKLLSMVTTSYLLFLDTNVTFTEDVFERYIQPALDTGNVLLYKGENNILCTKILGINTILLRHYLNGFDSSFHIGEDLELGCKMALNVQKYGVFNKEHVIYIPSNAISHKKHKRKYSYLDNLRVRVRLALRYNDNSLIKIQRKKDYIGVFLLPLIIAYYSIYGNYRCGYIDRKYTDEVIRF